MRPLPWGAAVARQDSTMPAPAVVPTSMDKTTIYLPAELKSAINQVARQRRVSEAEVIRDSIRAAIGNERPRPRGGLFASGAPIAREADEHLTGVGER